MKSSKLMDIQSAFVEILIHYKFDKTLKLYSLMTTKPEEVEARKQKEMEE